MLETILTNSIVQATGWALLHFVWQGALIALTVACVLMLMRASSAHARYVVATLGLMLMLIAPIATVWRLNSSVDAEGSDLRQQQARVETGGAQASSRLTNEGRASQQDAATGAARPIRFAPFQNFTDNWFSPLLSWLVLFWLAGIAFLSARLFRGWMATERLRRRGAGRVSEIYQEAFERLRRRIGVARPVRLYKSVLVEVPTVIGWLRPVVLVPVSAFTGLSREQLEALLAHELAHIRRYDYFVNLLQAVAETLLFYHPAVWWVSAAIRTEREHACDDLAVEACGNALVYARALAELEGLRASGEQTLALAATGGGGSLIKRIRRLVAAPPARREQRSSAWVAATVLFLTLSGALMIAQGALLTVTDPEALSRDALVPKREVAVTFVSLPYFRGGDEPLTSLDEMTTKLLRSLATHDIRAVGFVGESSLSKEGETEARINFLKRWLDEGHELGNQGYKHLSLYKTPLAEYEANVVRGEQVLKTLLEERGQQLKYYSYPFLNTGPNQETKKAFEQFLKERGYSAHAVTIDNMDWIFSNAYLEARRRRDTETMRRISDEYVAYMERVFAHYEQLSMKVFGREIPQVLMLSASALNADNFERLAEMLKKRGYAFTTLATALKDAAYSEPQHYAGPWGISWIERWALEKGVNIRGDPVLPPYMRQFGKDGLSLPTNKQE